MVANRERTRFDRELLGQLPSLRIIAQTGNHAYHIDLKAAEECGVIIAKAPGGGCTSAAELAIGLMISVMRQIPSTARAVKKGDPIEWMKAETRTNSTGGIVYLTFTPLLGMSEVVRMFLQDEREESENTPKPRECGNDKHSPQSPTQG